jgi:mRNA export factor
VFSGGCDNKAKCWSLQTGQSVQVAQHSAPIKSLFWVEDMQCLMTGSWDKTLKYWDGRTSNAVHTASLPERLYCMDVRFPLCCVGTADRNIIIYDLRKPTAEFKVIIIIFRTSTHSILIVYLYPFLLILSSVYCLLLFISTHSIISFYLFYPLNSVQCSS